MRLRKPVRRGADEGLVRLLPQPPAHDQAVAVAAPHTRTVRGGRRRGLRDGSLAEQTEVPDDVQRREHLHGLVEGRVAGGRRVPRAWPGRRVDVVPDRRRSLRRGERHRHGRAERAPDVRCSGDRAPNGADRGQPPGPADVVAAPRHGAAVVGRRPRRKEVRRRAVVRHRPRPVGRGQHGERVVQPAFAQRVGALVALLRCADRAFAPVSATAAPTSVVSTAIDPIAITRAMPLSSRPCAESAWRDRRALAVDPSTDTTPLWWSPFRAPMTQGSARRRSSRPPSEGRRRRRRQDHSNEARERGLSRRGRPAAGPPAPRRRVSPRRCPRAPSRVSRRRSRAI